MARKYTNLVSSRSEYARALPGSGGGFRGVDFSTSPHRVAPFRCVDLQNMYRDYRSADGGALETIPGFRLVRKFAGEPINGLFRFADGSVDYIVVHAKNKLYLVKESDRDTTVSATVVSENLAEKKSSAFVYNNRFYLLDGSNYWSLTKNGDAFNLSKVKDNAYVPKTWYMGEQYEQRNMLTDKYRFVTSGADGSNAIEADVVADYAASGDNKGKYAGVHSFVVAGTNKGISNHIGANICVNALVFKSSKREGGAVISYTADTADSTITSLAFLSDGTTEQNRIAVGTINSLGALKYIYFSSTDGKKIGFAEDSKIEMGEDGFVFYGCEKVNVSALFSGASTALQALPPNVAIQQGTDVSTGVKMGLASSLGGGLKSDNIEVGTSPAAATAEKIYLYTGDDGFVHAKVGASVGVGRYFMWGSVFNSRGAIDFLGLRIEVVASAADLASVHTVTDVFNYAAEPKVFHLPERSSEVTSVKDEEFSVYFVYLKEDGVNIIGIGAMVRAGTNEISVEATAEDYHFGEAAVVSEDAIGGCTLCAIYDDRVFLSGNPALPNTVFYSARNDVGVNDPTYFGVLNYVNDGVGFDPITALLPFSDTLCVAKKNAFYFHHGADGSDLIPRVYPSVRSSEGWGSLGACCNFLDDPVFLSKEGVIGVNKQELTLERTFGRRSSTVDTRLLSEDERYLANARMVEWEGYLCLFVNGHVYMADSRAMYEDTTGNAQYEWFYLADVGVWRTDADTPSPSRIYAAVTGDLTHEDLPGIGETILVNGTRYPLAETHDEIRFSDDEVFSLEGTDFKVAAKDGNAFVVYDTGECKKGEDLDFYPAMHPLVIDNRLYFGTATGEVFVFNNDKRGVDVGDDEMLPTEIHSSYYSFAGHRIDSGFKTRLDDCDVPHLCKSTSSGSLVMRSKQMSGGGYVATVITEKGSSLPEEFSTSTFSFGGLDFGAVSFHMGDSATLVGKEKERRWVEKQYLFCDGGFCRPFGIYGVTYRYRIAGRIRE